MLICFSSDIRKVNFLREGCGVDKICQSNLKLSYQFGTRPLTSDLFTPLPKLASVSSGFSPCKSWSDMRVKMPEFCKKRTFNGRVADRNGVCVSVCFAGMRTTCRCSPCQTSDWWCWRSPSPTRHPTPCSQRRMETTLMPLSCSSLCQTRSRTQAPGSRHRYKVKNNFKERGGNMLICI